MAGLQGVLCSEGVSLNDWIILTLEAGVHAGWVAAETDNRSSSLLRITNTYKVKRFIRMEGSMSKKKLTLSVDEAVIRRAKRFSKRNETSVSRLVNEFLASLEDDETVSTPIVSRLRGVLPPSATRDEFRAHLEAKHE